MMVSDSVRFAGTDNVGISYYVASSTESDQFCIVVVKTSKDWGSSCGRKGEFTIELGDVTAWLGNDRIQGTKANETVADVVYVHR